MKYSYTVGRVGDIDIKLHISFLLLFFGILAWVWLTEVHLFVASFVFLIALFGTVLLHELSHSLVAERVGVRVAGITLLPIGGVAEADVADLPAMEEFKVAVAGPLFNIVVCVVLMVVFLFFPSTLPADLNALGDGDLNVILQFPFLALFWINFMLAAFNLLVPALPMDGGRILRSLLAMRLGNLRATQWSVRVSFGLTFLMFLVGFFVPSYRILLLIAVFVYLGARAEMEHAVVQALLAGMKVSSVLVKGFAVLPVSMSVGVALSRLSSRNLTSGLVRIDGGFGVVSVEDLSSLFSKGFGKKRVSDFVLPVKPLRLSDSCANAFKLLSGMSFDVWPVVSRGKLVGVVSKDGLNSLYRLRSVASSVKGGSL